MALRRHHGEIITFLLVGAFCLVYALGFSYIENAFSRLRMVIAILGAILILLSVAKYRKFAPQTTQKENIKRGFLVVLCVGLIVIALVFVNYFACKHNVRWDLTKNKQHTLSQVTKALIAEVENEITITTFYVGIPPKYIEDLLNEYERISAGKIQTEVIDPIVDIGYAAKFGDVISGKEKKVIVQSGNQRRDLEFSEEEPLNQDDVNNAIIRVTREKRVAYFLTGHREYNISDESEEGFSSLANLLLANNIISRRLILGIEGKMPDDCDVLIVGGPKDHLSLKEKRLINEYLLKGGDALFLVEHTMVSTPDKPLSEEELKLNPSLNDILNKWGVHIADDVVVDLSSHASGDVGCPATRNYMPHKAIIRDLDYTFYIRPRSISMLPNRRPTLKVVPFVLTTSEDQSWGETDRYLHVLFHEDIDRAGPVPISSVIFEPKEKGDFSDTRIIVFTDADFLSNSFIGDYSNAKMGLNIINWLTESDYKVYVDSKSTKIQALDLTSKQKRQIMVVLFAIVIVILTSSIIIWMQRKVNLRV